MIPRYQKVLFVILVLASLAMGVLLWQLRDRAQRRMLQGDEAVPVEAQATDPNEQATLLMADDQTNSMTPQIRSLSLPIDPGARASTLLGKLLESYSEPGAAHPVPGGATAVTQVFLVPLPASPAPNLSKAAPPTSAPAGTTQGTTLPPLMAVVNLTGAFAASHPSGLATENLTVLSICSTLHANLRRVAQVRFLVDGAERPTLAGHADLTRTYLTADAIAAEAPQK